MCLGLSVLIHYAQARVNSDDKNDILLLGILPGMVPDGLLHRGTY